MNVPSAGQWPVDPQTDVEVSKDRIWIDGCFDFTHHGIIIYQISSGCVAPENFFLRARWCDATGPTTRQVSLSRGSFR